MVDYGWGWEVNDGGSVIFDTQGRIQIVDGRSNLGQQLKMRLLSPKGSHPFNPEFGLDMVAMREYRKFYRNTEDLLEVVIYSALTGNKHVRRINYVSIVKNASREWDVEVRVVTSDGVETTFNAIIEQNSDIRDVNVVR
jgi:hypothetical protein